MLKQSLQQKLLQKLSPQQIQFIKLLQIPTASLEVRIEQELEENPALIDYSEPEKLASDDRQQDEDEDRSELSAIDEGLTDDSGEYDKQEISLEEYLNEAESGDYDYRTYQPDDPNEERYEAPIVELNTLYDSLNTQITFLHLNERENRIAQQIIGNLDEDGYLRRSIVAIADDLAFRQNLQVSDEEVEAVLEKVQQLEPAGVCARDLQECLLLQLDRKTPAPDVELASTILMDFYDEFTKKHFDKIMDRTGASETEFKAAYKLITRLNPKPGESQTAVKLNYIIPDFLLTVNNGEIDIKLNRKNAPDLRVNKRYLRMLEQLAVAEKAGDRTAKETVQFIKAKLDSAKWFIDAIKQRQYTLMNTMATIAEKQREFFISEGDEGKLRPMILKDVAQEIGLDISTVSRVANSKYVQTDFGIYQLKYFFSEGISTDSGEDVSNKEVKKILGEMISKENKKKPLSDDKLAKMLNDKGYNIARRTVAKYREQLNVPVARLRKEI